MAWTAVKTFTAAILSVSDMNTYVSDNTQYLKDDLDDIAGRTVGIDGTEVEVTNSTSAVEMYAVTVPANTLGANDILKFTTWGRATNDSVSDRNVNIIAKYGSTVSLGSGNITIRAGVTNQIVTCEGYIKANGATNAQIAWMIAAVYDIVFDQDSNYDAGTEDTTGALDFTIDAQWNAADTDLHYYHLMTHLQKLTV